MLHDSRFMIFGHQKIRQILQNQIKDDKLSHTYLFFGPEGIGKKMVAMEFARALLCIRNSDGRFCNECDSCRQISADVHPDFRLIEPGDGEGEKFNRTKEIGIRTIRQVIGWNKLKPILSSRKVVLVDNARWLSIEAQNAFLKSLEEPTGSTIFILIASSPGDLLETVVSRCQKIKFLPLVFDDFRKALDAFDVERARLLELYSIYSGQPGPARNFATSDGQKKLDRARTEFLKMFGTELGKRYQFSENLAKNEESLFETINLWRILTRDLIFAKKGLARALTNRLLEASIVKEAQNHQLDKLLRIFRLLGRLPVSLKETNLNPRLALDWVMTEL